ncbi:MAG: ABC transporter ATP-binding protein [Lachnospiraceae bacterium]|nr:ABC transporter ATP-binding protein [Lachnospiraceae bacterium]
MKKTDKGSHDALNRTQYSAIQNIMYCLYNTIQCHFPLLCWCALTILINVIIPVLSTYLPKTVIEIITAGGSFYELAIAILAFMGSIAILAGANKFLTKYMYHQKYRMNTFYLKRVALKGLTTDYINQENGIFRKLQTESFLCCNGNYSPLTNIYDVLIDLLTSILGLSVFWVILLRLNWWIIIFLIATTVISCFLNQKIIKWTAANSQERISYQQRINYINGIAGDNRSAKDIRLYQMAAWFSDIYKKNMNGLAGWYNRLTNKLFGVAVFDSGMALLRECVIYLYLLYLIWNEQISVADFILYFSVVTGFSTWLSKIFSQISTLNQINLNINYFRSYLEYPETFSRDNGLKSPVNDCPKIIELKNVSYKYEGAEQYALHHFSLTIAPGEHIAIVGLNGAGKTTLVKLICGLIEPTEGQVLYDGIDIREYNRIEYYKLFSAVFQQFSIMPVTIEEIVSETPSENIDHNKVKNCLTISGLWDKIEQLSDGVKSQFGKTIYDDGIEFSGGEIQKLLLARALYKRAPVMLLDEPTAALDPIAESTLYENYNKISTEKTTVFISHRLASTSFCDRIILIENGEICEEGTHNELLELNGKYYTLFEMQAKYYREKNDEREVSE